MSFSFEYLFSLFPEISKGLLTTLSMTFISFFIAFVIGVLLAIVYKYKVKGIYQISIVYVFFFRGSPIIAQMFFIYFGLPHIIPALRDVSAFTAATVTIGLNMSAYMVEVIRAAMDSVDKGQIEAGLSTGMTNFQVLKRIVFPQAARIAIPPLGNNFVMTLKGTAVAFTIGVSEIMAMAKIEASDSYRYFECYTGVMIMYLSIVLVVSIIQKRVEDRLSAIY